jgi:hypothetical protein
VYSSIYGDLIADDDSVYYTIMNFGWNSESIVCSNKYIVNF